VKTDSKFKSISDLKGKAVAFSSRTSTSGYLIPVWDMIKKGQLKEKQDPEMFFGKGNTWYGSGYVTAVQRVLDGTAEAAAVSDYVFLGDKHLNLEQKSQLRILQAQGPVPTHVIAGRTSLSQQQKKLLKDALLSLNADTTLRDQVFTSELIEVPAKTHLASTREALKLTGIEIKVQ
jgi:phosphonate transport system substrate-binding protein